MHKMGMALLAGMLSVGGAGRALAGEHEQKVTMAELPAPVQETLKREAKGGTIEELEKETKKDGTVVYEAEIVKKGKGTEIEVSAEGKVLERGKTHDESPEHEHQEK